MGIFRSIENFGNKVALISPDKGTFTYSQLLAETFILKNYIQGNSFILLIDIGRDLIPFLKQLILKML